MGHVTLALALTAMLCLNAVLPVVAFPQTEDARRFAVKPNNANKKVSAPQTPSSQGFPLGNLMGTVLQMMMGSANEKSDVPSAVQGGSSSSVFNWKSLVNIGFRYLLATMNSDGVDKQDSPMQGLLGTVLASFLGGQDQDVAALAKQAGNMIQMVTSLLDALKMSFSQRSSTARSLGTNDPFSDAGVATVTILKGYVKTHKTSNESCMQRAICEANAECSRDAPQSGYLFCQLGTYAAGYLLEKSSQTPLDAFTDAGRYGRAGESCAQIYHQCNQL